MFFSLIHFARSVAFSFSIVVFSACSQNVILFHLPIGFVRNNINNHRNNHFLHHAYSIFHFSISILTEKETDKHLPFADTKQNRSIKTCYPKSQSPEERKNTHRTLNKVNENAFQLFEKLSHTHTYLCIARVPC